MPGTVWLLQKDKLYNNKKRGEIVDYRNIVWPARPLKYPSAFRLKNLIRYHHTVIINFRFRFRSPNFSARIVSTLFFLFDIQP